MAKLVLVALLIWAAYLYLKPKPKRPVAIEANEARAILGVTANADKQEIRLAHRRLVQALHPDKGGSAELTRRINAARDTLLRRA